MVLDPRELGRVPNPARLGGSWQVSTVTEVTVETPTVKTFTLEPATWRPFRAGQHVDVRLTAPDGYQAQRSYSIASAPEHHAKLDITIELLDDGEVSPYFHHVVESGDQVEFRGPVGGPFTWRVGESDGLILVAGGSGIVPIMSMLRHREVAANQLIPTVLLYSSRTADDIIYRDELDQMAANDVGLSIVHTLTRGQPPGWQGERRRVDQRMFDDASDALARIQADGTVPPQVRCYICGPTDFVESVAQFALRNGLPAADIRTERFGPTGT